jgi:sugar phosphate isomerase/epimerase
MIMGAMNDPKKPVAGEIALFGEMGFDYFELTVEAPCAHPDRLVKEKKAVQDALSSYNFGVLAHMPWYFSVAHPYPELQDAFVREFCRAFDAAAEFGAKKATLHSEFLPAGLEEREVRVARTIEGIGRLRKEAEDRGLELLVENFNAGSLAIKEFKRLFSEVDVGMTLDVGHAFTADGEGLQDYLAQFRKRIRHVHLHDNDRRSDLHLPLGAGKVDVARAVKELKSFYDGTITLEVHSADRDYLRISREKLEILWFGRAKFEDNREYLQPGAGKR